LQADIEAAVAIANPDLKIPAVAPTNAAASQETAAAAQETKQVSPAHLCMLAFKGHGKTGMLMR
jgi:hypothetical protein